MSKPLLQVEHLTMQFGGVVAVNDFSMEINEGEIVALIGPNGAGKTTAFNCVTSVYEPTNGQILFDGAPLARNHPTGKMRRMYAGEMPERLPGQGGAPHPRPGNEARHCPHVSEYSPVFGHDGV